MPNRHDLPRRELCCLIKVRSLEHQPLYLRCLNCACWVEARQEFNLHSTILSVVAIKSPTESPTHRTHPPSLPPLDQSAHPHSSSSLGSVNPYGRFSLSFKALFSFGVRSYSVNW